MKKFKCENCNIEKEEIYHTIISDINGSKFVMLCVGCIESEKRISTCRTIKVFTEPEIRKSFE
jgi:hypothetical protein